MTMLLLAVMGSLWAGESEVYNFAFTQQSGASGYANTYTVTIGEKSWTIPGNLTNGDYLRIGGKSIEKVDRVIQCNDKLTGNISKIVFNHNGKSRANVTVHSVKVTVANDAAFTNIVDEVTVSNPTVEKNTEGSIDFTPNPNKVWSGDLYYKFTVNISNSDSSNGGLDLTSLVFYESVSGAVDPVVNFANESEEIEVGETVTNTLTKPNDLTVTYSSDPTSVATVDEDGVVTGVAEGEAEITASWEAVANKYNAGSVSYTVTVTAATQAVNYIKVTNANQLVAGNEYIIVGTKAGKTAAMGARTGTNTYRNEVLVTETDNKVPVKNNDGVAILTLGGSTGAWTFLASDNNEYLALTSNSNALHSSTDATLASSQWTITNDFQVQHNTTSRYIQYNSGATRFACYTSGQGPSYLYVKEGSSTSTEPSITVNTTSIDIPAEGADGTIEVTFTNVDPELTEVVFYDADGTTVTTCDWIVAEINGNNIEYLVDENEGEARTAYFKVHGLADNENDVYSELITITQAAAPEPAVTVSETSLELTAAESEGTINVTYTRTTPYELLFLDADGESSKEYDWIEAELDNDGNIYYLVDENAGEARSAYLKVLVLADADELLESNLITITQAAPTAPVEDYATLPFEFDGGKADIEGTSGLTQSDLGSDYKNSPYLKFDGTGDYVILKFNERPGKLTFDIQGNSFSGGTFTVQTSKDGVTYTDLENYTDLSSTQSEEITNLGENVRYIKWLYKEKSNGNVALGNIKLEKYGIDPELTISDVNTTINTDETLEISTLSEGEIEFDIENDDVCSISKQGDVYWLFAASAGTTTVTATQAAFGEYKSASVTFTVTVIDPEAKTHVYKKVTNTKDITSGRYLIVYEGSKVAFDGSLETLDAAENITDVEINNGVITLDEDKDVFYFNIDVNAGTIKSAYGYYIGGKTEYSNGLLTSDTDTYSGQTFIIDQESNAVITATNNTTLRYNKASDQLRFRYYKPGQQPIQLYKFDGFTFNISDKATDGTYYYATISNLGEGNFKVEGNVTVRTVCVDEGELTDLSVFGEGDVLPGNGAYLVDGAVYGDYAFPATEEACEETDLGENMLISTGEKGLSKDEMIAAAQAHYNNTQGEYKFYKLSLNKGSDIGSVGFYWGNSNGEAFQYKKGHQAFLAVPLTEEGTGSQVAAYLFNGDKTGIYNLLATEVDSENDATYSISGIRVDNKQLPKGIYIKNGKKVVVR